MSPDIGATTGETSSREPVRERAARGGGVRRIELAAQVELMKERLRVRGYAAATIGVYVDRLRDFGRYLDGAGVLDLRAVLRAHVEDYRAALAARHLSSSTRAHSMQAVARLFDDLVERGLLLLNPTASVRRLVRKPAPPRRVPTVRQMQRLLDAPDTTTRTGIRDRSIVEVLYGSALRAGELVALTVHEVDLEHRVLCITSGKGKKGRVVPLSSPAVRCLREYLIKARSHWARRWPSETALYLTNRGDPMDTGALRQMLLGLCLAAKLRRIGPHAIRHAAATHMLAAGADLRHVQKLLGHARLSTTQVYTRVAPAELKATHRRTHPRERRP